MAKHVEENKATTTEYVSTKQKIVNIVAIALCVILIPILVMNCILIVKGLASPDEVPSIFGKIPLIVLTESMDPEIKAGDLIICDEVDPAALKEGDVISYLDPDGSGSSIVTHRIIEVMVNEKNSEMSFRTKGDNNNIEDRLSVPDENIVGKWTEVRFWQLGRVLLFTQSTLGVILLIIIPVAAFVVYEIMKRKKQDQAKQGDIDALRAELEAMKAAQAAANSETTPQTESDNT
jgi:signal peptidase